MKKDSKLEENYFPNLLEWGLPVVGPLLYSMRVTRFVKNKDDAINNFLYAAGYVPFLALYSTIEMANLYAINQTIFPLLSQNLMSTIEMFHF